MTRGKNNPQGQGKIDFILIISALIFAILAFLGIINTEWRESVQNWILSW